MAKARERGKVQLLGVTGRKRSDLLIGTALQTTTLLVLTFPAWAQPAPSAMPTGGAVVAGSASIAQTANATTINQASQRAAINWQSFNIGSQGQVTFAQPSTGAIALNRVVGPDPSQIAGKISANGQLVLVNQAGVTFYKGAQVNAQSLIVSSANISNTNFMAGKLVFDKAGNPNASVVNQGTITVKQAGLAALVAPSVANSGVINAQLGHVVLAGAKTATLDLYGDGLLSLDVSNQVTTAPTGPGGKAVTALVTNTGTIRADGGTVQLTAAAADGVLQNLVEAGGKISANTVGAQTGTVTVAGIGGSVTVTGLLRAAGQAAGSKGGQVAVNATGDVTLASTARLNVSGQAGGGTVAIGTTLQRANGGPGTPSAMTASNVTVQQGARITASARKTGNGGHVTLLSTGNTAMLGTIAATGGSLSGNGGLVEESGSTIDPLGPVNLSAPFGNLGTVLLDPTNLDIVASGAITTSSVDNEFVGNTLPSGAADASVPPSTVSTATLTNLGTNAAVIVQASGTIDVQAPISVNNGLTIQAGSNLTIESGASIVAGGNILLQAGTSNPAGALVIGASVTSNNEGGALTLIAGTGGIVLNGNLSATSVDLSTTGGGVSQAANVGISATTLQSTNGVTGSVGLQGTNSVYFVEAFQVTGGSFQLVNTVPVQIDGPLATPGGNVFIEDTSEGGGITVAGSITTGTTNLASFETNFFDVSQGEGVGSVNAGTVELAPPSAQPVVLGSFGAGLNVSSLIGITAGSVRIGAVTPPGATAPVTEATAITISGTGGTFDLGNRNLELDATGAIDGSNGSLINVATLSGTGGIWTLSSNNTVADLGNISATSFDLNDGVDLSIVGLLNGGSSVTITGSGEINETGTLIAGTLSGSAVTAADFLGAGPSVNQIGTIGDGRRNFTASSFALRDGIGLTVAGTVTATSGTGQVFLASTAPAGIAIATTGNVTADAAGGTASFQTDLLTNGGAVGANTVELAPATSGGIVTLGATGSGLSLLSMTGFTTNNLVVGAVTEPTAPIAGSTTPLAGGTPTTTAGAITVAGAFTFDATGTLTLDASSSTSSTGASGAVTQSAPLTTSTLSGSADSFTLTNAGNSITTAADLTATNGNLALVNGANLTLAGTISGQSLFLEVAKAGGTLTLGTAVPAGGLDSLDPATLTAASRGRISLVADDIVATDTSSTVTAASGTVELAPFSAIDTSLLGNAATGELVIGQALLSVITPGVSTLVVGGFTDVPAGATTSAASAQNLSIDGALTLSPTATSLDLEAIGSITQSAPIISVGTLSGSSASTVLTNAGNTIGRLANYTASNGFTLTDATGLTISGALQAGPAATLNINGALTEAGGGITATMLTGNAIGSADLQGGNNIAELDGFAVSGNAGNFLLQDRGALLITGSLSGTRISVSASQITLGDGTTIITGGTVRPTGPVPPVSLFPSNGAPGAAFLSSAFTQNGLVTVSGQGGGPSTLQITATSGNVQFDPPLGLFGPETWLIVNAPDGRISGNIYVNALDVRYRQLGSADLFGSIDGNDQPSAASLAFIQPLANRNYLFNGCEIGGVACFSLSAFPNAPGLQVENTTFVPVDALLALVTPGLVLEPEDKDDLQQLPVVSREDY